MIGFPGFFCLDRGTRVVIFFTLRACARGKVISYVVIVVIVSTKITIILSRDVGI